MNKDRFNKIAILFWWIYILLPMFTGFLAYDWLPNESYDENKHELLNMRSMETGPLGMTGSEEVPESWRSIKTGKIYTTAMFAEHHKEATFRMAIKIFLYGLIGCLVYAYGKYINKLEKFIVSFRDAILANVAISVIIIFVTY